MRADHRQDDYLALVCNADERKPMRGEDEEVGFTSLFLKWFENRNPDDFAAWLSSAERLLIWIGQKKCGLSYEEACEATQETAMELYRTPNTFRPEVGAPKKWICTVHRNR